PHITATNDEEAVVAAGELGYPVVVKADDPNLRVRSGGAFVRADLRTPEDVRSAFLSLQDRFGDEADVVVQRMAAPGVPTIVRAGRRHRRTARRPGVSARPAHGHGRGRPDPRGACGALVVRAARGLDLPGGATPRGGLGRTAHPGVPAGGSLPRDRLHRPRPGP